MHLLKILLFKGNFLHTIPKSVASSPPNDTTWPTMRESFTKAPFASPQGVPFINFKSMPAFSLLTMTNSWNWMAPQFTHSAPFSQFQVVNFSNFAGLGVVASHLSKINHEVINKIRLNNQIRNIWAKTQTENQNLWCNYWINVFFARIGL